MTRSGDPRIDWQADRQAGPAPEAWHMGLARVWRGTMRERVRFILFVALLALVAGCGGSSRPDAWQLLPLRPIAILLAAASLAIPGPIAGAALRMPALLLAALAAAVAVQLVPLPPGIWQMLPGHGPFVEAAAAAGVPQPWRPITLSFDQTLNSLVALAVPAAVLLGAAALRPEQRAATLGLVMALAVASALLGLAQVTSGAFYLYTPTTIGRPVGLFANINHQAALLAAVLPVTAAWAVGQRRFSPVRAVLGAAAGALLLATILVSGSRGGLLLAAMAVLSVPLVIGDRIALAPRVRLLALSGVVVTLVALVLATWAAGRLSGLDRLLGSGSDQRVTFLPITLGMLRGYFPFGSGFGTFDAAFRLAEPDAMLKLTYFNHAHNDALELGITGGLAALAVAAAYVAWVVRRGIRLLGQERRDPAAMMGRAGVFSATLLLLASLADYPLRTPLAMALLALASLWMADRTPSADRPVTAR